VFAQLICYPKGALNRRLKQPVTPPTAIPAPRLTAILAADAVGYSLLMAANDRLTVELLDAARAVFRQVADSHQGRVVDMAGDSVLIAFNSAASAVRCALAAQARLTAPSDAQSGTLRLPFRIGVHLGDVIEKADGSVYGDGVNIAARLQALAEADEVFVSQSIRDLLGSKPVAEFEDVGEHQLKNVPRPLRVWRALPSKKDPQEGAAQTSANADVLRFAGRYGIELQPQQRRLLVDGEPATLSAKAFDLLLELAKRPGDLRSRNELIEAVWPGVMVEDGNLAKQIGAFRDVLAADRPRGTSGMTDATYRFGRFELRAATRELCADGVPQRLGERAFDLLLALAEAGGAVVTRDTLFEKAWAGRVVIDDNLKVQVMALRKLLGAEAVVTVPGHGYRLGLPLRSVAEAADASATPAAAPAASALIGRADELAALQDLLAPGRLVTLVGPGGAGKTRLAGAVLEAWRERLADGVAWVELASLTDPAQLPAAVAQALRLPTTAAAVDAGQVAAALRSLQLLLVLDNCEHLLDATAALVATVRDAAPGVALLATSQAPLGLRGESVQRLDGLRLPGSDADTAAPAPALALFAARAQAADPGFSLAAPGAAAAAAAICRRLEGLPLALELAAARVPLLGVSGVLERLDQQLRLLTRGAPDAPARQQTLRATLQWSHALLDEAQRVVFRRIAVFGDHFTLPVAQAVAGDDTLDAWGVLDALDALVARSLLRTVDVEGERRYRLMSTARAFALEQLAQAGEHDATMRRLARCLLELYEEAEAHFLGAPLKPWVDRLWPWVHDLRAALRWARGSDGADRVPTSGGDPALLLAGRGSADGLPTTAGDPALLLALASAAGPFWAAAGLDREAAPWLDAVRPQAEAAATDAQMARYCKALALRSVNPTAPLGPAVAAAERGSRLYESLGDPASAYRLLGIVAQNARRVDPPREVAPLFAAMRALEQPDWSAAARLTRLRVEGVAMARSGDWAGYRERFRLEAALLAEAGDELRAWGSSYHVALAEMALGRPDAAVEVLVPVVQRLRETGLLREQWTRPALLTMARIEAGEGPAAAAAVRETIALLRIAGARHWCADHLACWAAFNGAHETAARLLGWADATTRRAGPRMFHAQGACDRTLALLTPALDAERLQQLRAEGAGLDDEMALLRVLQVADAVQRPAGPGP
jgi:predicted ATPase/class 3 adenylate cyclase/DNA-binding winged helix-turn-helix (wHTH) protein